MKRIFALALAATLLLCGCGGNNDGGVTPPPTPTNGIVIHDTTLFIGGNLSADKQASLGEPISTSEAPSCLYEGMDTVREYDGFTLQTYRVGETDVIVMVTIETAAFVTDKGIKVGDTAEAVSTAYGAAAEETKNYVVYNDTPTTTLTFSLKNGVVTAIEYAQAAA